MTMTVKDNCDTLIREIKDCYDRAHGLWDGWDWPHSFGQTDPDCLCCRRLPTCGSQIVVEGPLDSVAQPENPCQHWRMAYEEAKEYEDQCNEDAVLAELAAGRAVSHVETGEWAKAAEDAAEAARIERQYGDSPTWGQFAELCAQLHAMGQLLD